jgi:hypothetical protein
MNVRFRLILACALILACCTSHAAAAVITVRSGGSISDTIMQAATGDTIIVESGTYQENIVINKQVSLKGTDTGGGMPRVVTRSGSGGVAINADGVVLEGFDISGLADCGILIASDRATIRNNIIHGLDCGISIGKDSSGVAVYANDFANSINAQTESNGVTWFSAPLTYTYSGSTHTGPVGNYWSDYSGTDADGDGIGDSTYSFSLKTDNKGGGAVFARFKRITDEYPRITTLTAYTFGGITVAPTPAPTVSPVIGTATPTASPTTGTPAPTTGEPAAENVTGVSDGSTGPAAALFSTTLLLILVLAGFFLGSLYMAGAQISREYRGNLPPLLARVAAPGYLITGVLLLIISIRIVVEGYRNTVMVGQFLPISAIVAFLLVYLALSSFLLVYSTVKNRPVMVAHRVHPVIGVFTVVLMFVFLQVGAADRLIADTGLLFLVLPFSIVISEWHYRSMDRIESQSSGTSDVTLMPGAGEEAASYAAKTAFFPVELQEKYTDIEYVGKGGIARVFRGKRRTDGKIVAIKVPISFDEVTGKSFMKEMRIWEGLHHKNIVELYAVNILPSPYVEMEYLESSLRDQDKPMKDELAIRIIRGIAEGLSYAHENGVIHRDIKPHNILIDRDGNPKITDWGLGKVMADAGETSIIGFSLTYAAPEQIAPEKFGKSDARTDIYQLGVVLYELLAGEPPFAGQSLSEFYGAILTEPPKPPSERNPELAPYDPVILRCLEKEPGARYQTVWEFIEALDATNRDGR